MESGFRQHAAWLLVCLAYLFAFPYYPRINNPNENARIWATRAVVVHHVLNIDEVEREWGWVNDKAKNEHHVYSGKAPGTSFLGVPVLYVHTQLRQLFGWGPPGKGETTFWLRLFAVKLPLCAFFYAFARWARRVTRSSLARDLLVVGLALGTLLYPYGGMFVGHALAAATAFCSYMLLDEPRAAERDRSGALRLAAAGLFAGLTVMFEYQAALVAVALTLYALARHRARIWLVLLGALPPAIALGAYHTALFGRPWRFPFGAAENPVFARTAHAAGFHGLTLPHPEAFPAFTISPSYGLFLFSPILAVGLGAAFVLLRRGPRREATLTLAICALMFLFLAGMQSWRAGWCVGPRYIATVAPFLMVPLAQVWPRFASRWWLPALAAGLLIPSVLLNVLSGALYPHYPEAFDNPVFDLAFPLLADGFAPYGLGWRLGLRGLAALAPLAAVVLAALALVLSGDDPRPRRWAAQLLCALGVAALFLGALASYGRAPRADEQRAARNVRAAWDPAPSRLAESRP
jgi:hypothetical protein